MIVIKIFELDYYHRLEIIFEVVVSCDWKVEIGGWKVDVASSWRKADRHR